MKRQTLHSETHHMTMLKRHRLAKGLTLADVGKRIGKSTAAVSAWETGRNVPGARVIPKLARVLGVDAMELTELISPRGEHAERVA